jgi:hypothetical protein
MPPPKGYTLDAPKLPAGYTLDSPAQPVKTQPTETLRPLSFKDQLTAIKPITSRMSLPEKAETFMGNIGGGGLGVLLHPLDTAKGIASSVLNPVAALKATYDAANTRPMETLSAGIGQTGALAPLAELAPKLATPALRGTGEAAQESGVGLMNRTAGSLKSDFKRGANPGKAYLDAGGGPTLSMSSLAAKGAELKNSVGANIGAVRNAATKRGVMIDPQRVYGAMAPALKSAVDLETGPGGTGNLQPIQDYASSFSPAFKDAYDAGGFTPNQVADLKTRIAKTTNWSEPSQFNLKTVRQQNTGALGGLLSDELPELKPLNSQYQGLMNFSKRAQLRADTHSMPLTSLATKTGLSALGAGTGMATGHPILGALTGLAADSVPFKTTLATGLYRGGGVLDRLATVPAANPAAVSIPAYGLIASSKKKNSDDGK